MSENISWKQDSFPDILTNFNESALSIMGRVLRNGISDRSSNPQLGFLLFT